MLGEVVRSQSCSRKRAAKMKEVEKGKTSDVISRREKVRWLGERGGGLLFLCLGLA